MFLPCLACSRLWSDSHVGQGAFFYGSPTMTMQEKQQEALHNALYGRSWANYPAIIQGFIDKGIPEQDILPRENVFTFHAWKALGRRVKKGEHGVKVSTWVPMEKTVEQQTEDGQTEKKTIASRRPWMTTVFHVSQTEPDPYAKANSADAA